METRKLNILMRYPIEWTVYMVMNNFVQNFYDAVGPENFAAGFKMDYSGDTLTLEAASGFSKEWLYYLGASTKRDDDRHHAGHFGEGFKMAALVAYRDMKLGITMESQDWHLVVTQADQMINGASEKVLAYDLFSRPYSDTSKLTLSGVNEEQYDKARSTIKSFYYEENPRFGDLIVKNDEIAVFKSKSKHTGGVFVNLEFRRSLPFPLYFCVHRMDIDKDDRDRTTLSTYMMRRAVDRVLDQLDSSEAAMEILEAFSPVWLTLKDAKHRCRWNSQISKLIDLINEDEKVQNRFYEKYKDTLIAVIPPVHPSSKNQRKTAFSWYQQSPFRDMRRVSYYFTDLGIKDLYTLCEENGGLELTAPPDSQQLVRIKLLEEVAQKFFSQIYCYGKLPTCNVLVNKSTAALGEAYTHKTDRNIRNSLGVKVTSDISEIYLAKETLDNSSFYRALPIYIHELLHQFGGDSSTAFHSMLVEMNRIILENRREINEYAKQW